MLQSKIFTSQKMKNETTKPLFFANQEAFREWLEQNHAQESELLVGFYKVGTGKPSMTWSESVDQALCFGWIDAVRKSIDAESYSIRFTPRRANSIWSAVNIRKVEELTQKGLMQEAGLKAFSLRKPEKSVIYAYENEPQSLSESFETVFKKHESAWNFFIAQAPSYRNSIIHWIMSAKQTQTQITRLEKIIQISAKFERLK